MAERGLWSGDLAGAGGRRARLAYYPPDVRQAPHRHDVPHVSVVIAGSLRETTNLGEDMICHGRVAFRADGARHSVCFGPAGALILTVETGDWVGEGAPRSGVRWLGASSRFGRDLLGLARTGTRGAGAEIEDRLLDIWAVHGQSHDAVRRAPPAWLARAAEQLVAESDGVTISALARGLGVHRVHLARAFHRHYGMAPSVFRRRAMTSRAISLALAGRASHAAAAAEAGFADQSHMSRSVRESCGLALRDLRRVLAG